MKTNWAGNTKQKDNWSSSDKSKTAFSEGTKNKTDFTDISKQKTDFDQIGGALTTEVDPTVNDSRVGVNDVTCLVNGPFYYTTWPTTGAKTAWA